MSIKKIIFVFSLIFITTPVFAAEIYLAVPESVSTGDTFEVIVNIDSSGATINSMSVTIGYDDKLVSFTGYRTEDTLVSLWVSPPRDEAGKVTMSGIIPGGASGLYDPEKTELVDIPVVSLLFTPREAGTASFELLQSEILQHDGNGTLLSHERRGDSVNISGNNFSGLPASLDKDGPEPFEIIFLESGFFSRTPPMLLFSAVDLGTGIKEYGMRVFGLGWRKVTSPAPVARGVFPKNITIRAFDHSGNYQDASITIPGILPNKAFGVLGVVLVLALCLGAFKMLKYRS